MVFQIERMDGGNDFLDRDKSTRIPSLSSKKFKYSSGGGTRSNNTDYPRKNPLQDENNSNSSNRIIGKLIMVNYSICCIAKTSAFMLTR